MMLLINDSVLRNARQFRNREALVMGPERVTYGQLQEHIGAAVAGLASQGVRRGDHVAVLAKNSLEQIYLYFAAARLGAALAPINYWLRPGEVLELLEVLHPRVLLVTDEFHEAGVQAAKLDPAPTVISLEGPSEGWPLWSEVGTRAPAEPPIAEPADESDAHLVTFTSGSTGRPKAVARSQRRSVLNAMAASLALGLDECDRTVVFFPFFNVGAWEAVFHKYLYVGGAAIIMPRFDAGPILDVIQSERVTTIFANPAMYTMLMDENDAAPRDLSSIRFAYIGGMLAPDELFKRLESALELSPGEIMHTYGLTEGGPWVTLLKPADAAAHPGSIGRAIAGAEVALVDDSTGALSHHGPATGEIAITGELLMKEYVGNPAETEAAFRDGWLMTGDIARRDEDGFYYIVDRKKDVIRPGGQNVYPAEVERELLEDPRIRDVAVIGVPDATMVEAVCAVVVPTAGVARDSTTALAILADLRARMAGYKVPSHLLFVDSLPRTGSAKLDKPEIRSSAVADLGL